MLFRVKRLILHTLKHWLCIVMVTGVGSPLQPFVSFWVWATQRQKLNIIEGECRVGPHWV